MDQVKKGTIIVTDEWGAYKGLKKTYKHEVVKHNKGQYVNDNGLHTNSIEGFWSLFKRGIYGIYHQISPRHLHRYCNEFSLRYNTRTDTTQGRFDFILSNSTGRLTYKALIA